MDDYELMAGLKRMWTAFFLMHNRLTSTSAFASVASKYLIRKSKRKDFPLRNAPATERTTTFLFFTRLLSRMVSNASVFSSKEWSSLAVTI